MIERRGSEPGSGFRYLEFLPEGEREPAGAVIHLHGIGERGDDLAQVKRFGLPALVERGAVRLHAALCCPQLEAGQEWQPERLLALVAQAKQRYPRIALLGYSLGGLGVCDLVAQYGAVADLMVAIAGRCRTETMVPQLGVNFLALQGELDPWPAMHGFVQSVGDRGGVAEVVTLPGLGHFISEEALWQPTLEGRLAAVGMGIERISG